MTLLLLDTSNLYYASKIAKRGSVNYAALIASVEDTSEIIAYVNTFSASSIRFINMLEGLGVEVRTKTSLKRENGIYVTNWSVELAIDILGSTVPVTLVSNDIDLLPAIQLAAVPVHLYACGVPEKLKPHVETYKELSKEFFYEPRVAAK